MARPNTPQLQHHKASGRARVRIDGRDIYLGPWGDPATDVAYHRLIAEWASNGHSLPVDPQEVTIAELGAKYIEHCAGYYVGRFGEPTSTNYEVKRVVDTMVTLYGDYKVVEFKPRAFKACRQVWIDDDLSITTINSYSKRLRAMFRWGVENELVPIAAYEEIRTVPGLRRGRGVGRDTAKRQTVPLEHVEAVCEHLPSPLRAVVKLLLLTGARPSEILKLKRGDVDCKGDVWAAVIWAHKLSHRGITRTVYFGPRAQNILRPFLLRGDDEYLFSPREAEAERHAACKYHRPPGKPRNPKKTTRVIGYFYDHTDLARAIRRVCDAKGIERWVPYQLRHAACTAIEATADIEVARAILGHSELDTTKIYLHKDHKAAVAYAAQHG